MIGGAEAERESHIRVCLGCLVDLWSDYRTACFRQPATGHLLRCLLRGRYNDYGIIIRTLLLSVRHIPLLVEYILGWVRGHFIEDALIPPDSHRDRQASNAQAHAIREG